MSAALRIFSYVPNPRIAKATIVARLCGVPVEIRGAAPKDLADWLWDYDAHPMDADEKARLAHLVVKPKAGFTTTLLKTEAFLAAHPFGTVPAAFGPDGQVGIFESNSIMRAVARVGADRHRLYGDDPWSASRIDSFLDVGLHFGRDVQAYVLGLRDTPFGKAQHDAMRQGMTSYLGGIERALGNGAFIAGDALTLADIAFVCEFSLLQNERNFTGKLAALDLEPLLQAQGPAVYPKAYALFDRLVRDEAFAPDLAGYLAELPIA